MRTTTPAACETLESRQLLNAAFDLIGLSQLRADPAYAGLDGSGITVAVLDTGLDRTHVKLAANYVAGRDVVTDTDNPVDREAHGTHVAGIIGSVDPEIGVATGAGLVGVKVLGDDGSGTFTDIRDGLRWVYDHRTQYKIQVVNMSLGGGFYTSVSQTSGDILFPEIRRLEAAGITVVSAAGNSFKNHEYQNYSAPGIYSTLVVGAMWKDGVSTNVQWGDGAIDYTTGAGRITSFSQRMVAANTIFAPGAFMRSTVPGNRYESMAGTSQASPVVAGAVAIMQEAAKQFGGRLLSPAEVREIITSTAVTMNDGDDENDNVANTRANYPRLDLYAAVRAVRERLTGTTPPPGGGGTVSDANGVLSGAFLMNPSIDGSETLRAGGRIGIDFGTTQVGAADVDMFRFATLVRGSITIATSPSSTSPENFDAYLRLFTAGGVELAFDDDGAGGGYAKITRTLDAGTYYVGVSGKGNRAYSATGAAGRVAGATGSYDIAFSLSNSGDPNGVVAGAVAVTFGTDAAPVNFQGLIGRDYGELVGATDVDMFKVVAPDDGVLAIDIDTDSASGFVDSFIRLFNEQGAPLASNDDAAGPGESLVGDIAYQGTTPVGHSTDSYASIVVRRGQTYYVAVSDYNNQDYDPQSANGRLWQGPDLSTDVRGTYRIYLAFRSIDADGTISSAKYDAALVFPFNSVVGAIGSDDSIVVGDKDVDFYRFSVSRASLLEVEVDSAVDGPVGGTVFDAVLSLYDADGKLVASNDDFEGTDPVLQYVVQPGRDYFIAVTGFGNDNIDPFVAGSGTAGETGDYLLSGRLFATGAVKTISDDAIGFSRIANLPVGSSARGTLGADVSFNSGKGDVDLFRFIAPDNGVLSVAADGPEQFAADPFLRVFDSSGKELAYNDNRSDETRGAGVTASLLKGRTYYVGVSGAGDLARAYDPRRFGSAAPGSTGSYVVAASFNLPPTISLVSTLALADAGLPFTISHDALLAAANESDPEGAAVSFVVGKPTSGTLTRNGVPIIPGVTAITPGESLVWTPSSRSAGLTKAFPLWASDGTQRSAKSVQVSVQVNQAPTLTGVKDLVMPVGATTLEISYASLLAAANESDRNRDVISFRIDSVVSGQLLLDGAAVTAGQSLLASGGVLTFRPPEGLKGRMAAFTLRAFDGRLHSAASITVNVRVS